MKSGSVLDIEIGGTAAGTQFDVLNVNGTCTLNGSLNVRLLNGFGSDVQGPMIFDVVTASSIATALTGARIAVAGPAMARSKCKLAQRRQNLRLANFRPAPPRFPDWASRFSLTGADAEWTRIRTSTASPNLLEYALGLDPTAPAGGSPLTIGTVTVGGDVFLSLSFTRPTGAGAPTDLIYQPEKIATLASIWSFSTNDVVTHAIDPGPDSLETVTIRSTTPMPGTGEEFLRLQIILSLPQTSN